MTPILSRLRQQWFLLLLAGVVAWGWLLPVPDMWLHDNLGLKAAIVTLMFLISVTLPVREMWRSVRNWRGLATALAGGYLILPLILFGFSRLPFPEDLRIGLILVAAGPTTLASAAIWARLAGGNDGLSLVATILSNALCFLVAPLIIWLLMRQSVALPAEEMRAMALDLFFVIVVPVATGQLARLAVARRADAAKTAVSVICRLLVLSVVLTSVSLASEEAGRLGTGLLLAVLLVTSAAHGAGAAACWFLAGWLGCPRRDRIAATFSGAQKTLPVGLFLASFFSEQHPLAILPVLCYHAMQLLIDTVLVETMSGEGGTGVRLEA